MVGIADFGKWHVWGTRVLLHGGSAGVHHRPESFCPDVALKGQGGAGFQNQQNKWPQMAFSLPHSAVIHKTRRGNFYGLILISFRKEVKRALSRF